MAGGSGFIVDSNKTGKDNRNLGKIRPRLKSEAHPRSGKNARILDLKDAIKHRFQIKNESRKLTLAVFLGIFIGIVILCLYLFFSN